MIWDWNGTLFDDAWLCLEGINLLLESRGHAALTKEEYQRVFTFPVEDYYRDAGFDLQKDSFKELGTKFMMYYRENISRCSLRQDAKMVLKDVQQRGVSQSILSAYKHDWLEQIVGHYSLLPFFTGLLGCDDYYAYGKVENGKKWIEGLDCTPNEVIMVGDTMHDVEVAHAMGTDVVLINGGNQSIERLKTCNVPVMESLVELLTFIDAS